MPREMHHLMGAPSYPRRMANIRRTSGGLKRMGRRLAAKGGAGRRPKFATLAGVLPHLATSTTKAHKGKAQGERAWHNDMQHEPK